MEPQVRRILRARATGPKRAIGIVAAAMPTCIGGAL
jgi:hypothetical protein